MKDKKVAKHVVELLNDTRIPRKYVHNVRARSYVWNLKYLKGFGWHHLKEYKSTIQQLQRKKMERKIVDAERQASYFQAQVRRAQEMTKRWEQGVHGGYLEFEDQEETSYGPSNKMQEVSIPQQERLEDERCRKWGWQRGSGSSFQEISNQFGYASSEEEIDADNYGYAPPQKKPRLSVPQRGVFDRKSRVQHSRAAVKALQK